MACPGDETLFDFVVGKLAEDRSRTVHEHVATCDECRAVVADAARGLTVLRSSTTRRSLRRRLRWPLLVGAAAVLAATAALLFSIRGGRRIPDTACSGGDAAFVASPGGRCYTRHDRPLPWAEARAQCHRLGGELFSYSSYGEAVPVNARMFGSADTARWLGLQADAGGAYHWVTGEPMPAPGLPWVPGEPAEGPCGLEGAGTAAGVPRWRAAPCTRPLPYVCESAPWTVRPVTGHGYKLFHGLSTWEEARAACAREGAHLVTLADLEEQAFVAGLFHLNIWIGAGDHAREQTFVWTTGEPFTFTRFAPLEPDDPTGLCDCIAMGPDKLWHDRPCDMKYGYVCEID